DLDFGRNSFAVAAEGGKDAAGAAAGGLDAFSARHETRAAVDEAGIAPEQHHPPIDPGGAGGGEDDAGLKRRGRGGLSLCKASDKRSEARPNHRQAFVVERHADEIDNATVDGGRSRQAGGVLARAGGFSKTFWPDALHGPSP